MPRSLWKSSTPLLHSADLPFIEGSKPHTLSFPQRRQQLSAPCCSVPAYWQLSLSGQGSRNKKVCCRLACGSVLIVPDCESYIHPLQYFRLVSSSILNSWVFFKLYLYLYCRLDCVCVLFTETWYVLSNAFYMP